MQNWKLTLTYDGTNFHGWQVQPGLVTIQGELQSALQRILGESPLPQGSGRTDAGVHARAQVASFTLAAPIPAPNLERALNRTLPAAIRILRAEAAPDSFHARHSSMAKTYEYRMFLGKLCSPFLTRYLYHCRWQLDIDSMMQATQDVLGEHDFLSLAATDPDLTSRNQQHEEPLSTIRTIFSSEWTLHQHDSESGDARNLLIYKVRGNGFLHHMVRNLVGTMVEIGRGHFPADAMLEILAARSRTAAGPTAPAHGLFLHSVEYPVESMP